MSCPTARRADSSCPLLPSGLYGAGLSRSGAQARRADSASEEGRLPGEHREARQHHSLGTGPAAVFKGSVEKIIFLLKLEERNECKNNRYIITNPAWSRSPSCPRSCETKLSVCVYGRMSPGGQKCPGALRLSCGPESRQDWPGGGASAPGVMWRARKGTQRGSGGGSGLVP